MGASSRRTFLQAGSAAMAAGAVASGLSFTQPVHAGGTETLKVGLIGCGGRGSGAAVNACNADPNVKLTAMCDLFADRVAGSRKSLAAALGDKYAVTDDQVFTGFDGYKKLLGSEIDIVILATPPYFRPEHLAASIESGKHVFCEKPVAVDGPGCRSVLETVEKAREKKLSIVSGLCWRYDYGVRDIVKRVMDGEIGRIRAIETLYLTGTLWHRGNPPEWSELENQCRNWLYYTWLSGDHIAEQHVHSLDKALWLNNDELPLSCFGLGGRQVRTEEKFGNIYDHFAVSYEFPEDVKVMAYTRQMKGCFNRVNDQVIGTEGRADLLSFSLSKLDGEKYRYRGPRPSMYDVEHREMIEGIRKGEPINNGVYMTRSTLMAVMGRMACYTGQNVTAEQALNSQQKLGPASFEWGDVEEQPIATPGVTKLS